MRNDEEIKTIKQELLEKYNIKTDRDLIQQLGIQDEDKSKLFAWIRYQCAYSYREGFDNGKEELKEQLAEVEELESDKDKMQDEIDALKERISDLETDIRSYQ